MTNKQHSYTGAELTGAMTGFSEYSTAESVAEHSPRPVLTPVDLLNQISELRRFMKVPELEYAIKALADHMADTNNPHRTDLSQFTDQVIDVLYKNYTANGGEGSRGYFANILFKVLHVASDKELDVGTDNTALLSVNGVRSYLHAHEADPDAHAELIEKIMPGKPMTSTPVYALYSNIGIAYKNLKATGDVPYTYVDSDRIVKTATKNNPLPQDYTYNEPLIACFGERTNLVSNSTDFSKCTLNNVTLSKATVVDPMGNQEATQINTSKETQDRLHYVAYPKLAVETNTNRTFSVYVKPEVCKYFMLSYNDMSADTVVVRAIFNLEVGSCIVINHMDRYSAECIPLANGWYRCSISIYHAFGQVDDLYMTFFKEKDPKLQNFGYPSEDNEVAGYLYGMQCEDGNNTSPYIPTTGKAVTRKPVEITVWADNTWKRGKGLTYAAVFRNTGEFKSNSTRPLLTALNAQGLESMNMIERADGMVEYNRWATLDVQGISTRTMTYYVLIVLQLARYMQLIFGMDDKQVMSAYNNYTEAGEVPQYHDDDAIVYIGRDQYNRYAESYFKQLIVYPVAPTAEQCAFINGELIHD